MNARDYGPLDQLLIGLDQAVGTAFGRPAAASRPYPADPAGEGLLDAGERRNAAALMRVNHAGEVAAQALYQAQGVVARKATIREAMQAAASEETDHLAWCERRLGELGGGTSRLNPLWYAGSFAIGAVAGLFGDRWNLGFVAETERQVVRHLGSHLERLPAADARSRAIVMQMKEDEARHSSVAVEAGGCELPAPVRRLMAFCSRIMTTTAYRV